MTAVDRIHQQRREDKASWPLANGAPKGSSSHNVEEDEERITLGSILGSATGEGDRDVVPGGWSGTEDATSTAPSDMLGIPVGPDGAGTSPNLSGIEDDLGGFSDLLETDTHPLEAHRRKRPYAPDR